MIVDDPRNLGEMAAAARAELAASLAALGSPDLVPAIELQGPAETAVRGLAAADQAGPGDLTFAIGLEYLRKAEAAGAAAVIVPPALAGQAALPALVTAEPRLVFAVLLGLAGRERVPGPVAGEAFFADRASVTLGPGVVIGPQAYLGRNVAIGAGTVIGPQVFLDDGVVIGDHCLIHPRAVLRWGVRVGNRCQIHAGAVLGEDGFGYTQMPDTARGRLIHYKNAHLGGVVIEDDVEIGALTAVDRGLVSDTVVGRGSKIDNLVQIGHNVQVGRDCLLVSQVGVGGHTTLGDRSFLLGQVGLGPGVTIGADAVLTGQAGVGSGRIPPGRRMWMGTPARPSEEVHRTMALSASLLPKLRALFQLLKKSESFSDLKSAFAAAEKEEKK